ncbi:hypothetical protein [Pontixanthobacter luteolus]|uniref:hypothetical protein n=1 Tax=Pontixanthobacter luteolus TaxID=295089 RepID=UPI0023031EB5|nr:hypothetical protein [Pontixanthobacter luteolus]
MTAFVLGTLFAVAAVATLISLADSAVRGHRAYQHLRQASQPDCAAVPQAEVIREHAPAGFALLAEANTYRIARSFRENAGLADPMLLPAAA